MMASPQQPEHPQCGHEQGFTRVCSQSPACLRSVCHGQPLPVMCPVSGKRQVQREQKGKDNSLVLRVGLTLYHKTRWALLFILMVCVIATCSRQVFLQADVSNLHQGGMQHTHSRHVRSLPIVPPVARPSATNESYGVCNPSFLSAQSACFCYGCERSRLNRAENCCIVMLHEAALDEGVVLSVKNGSLDTYSGLLYSLLKSSLAQALTAYCSRLPRACSNYTHLLNSSASPNYTSVVTSKNVLITEWKVSEILENNITWSYLQVTIVALLWDRFPPSNTSGQSASATPVSAGSGSGGVGVNNAGSESLVTVPANLLTEAFHDQRDNIVAALGVMSISVAPEQRLATVVLHPPTPLPTRPMEQTGLNIPGILAGAILGFIMVVSCMVSAVKAFRDRRDTKIRNAVIREVRQQRKRGLLGAPGCLGRESEPKLLPTTDEQHTPHHPGQPNGVAVATPVPHIHVTTVSVHVQPTVERCNGTLVADGVIRNGTDTLPAGPDHSHSARDGDAADVNLVDLDKVIDHSKEINHSKTLNGHVRHENEAVGDLQPNPAGRSENTATSLMPANRQATLDYEDPTFDDNVSHTRQAKDDRTSEECTESNQHATTDGVINAAYEAVTPD